MGLCDTQIGSAYHFMNHPRNRTFICGRPRRCIRLAILENDPSIDYALCEMACP